MVEINGKQYYPRFTFNTIAKFCEAKEIDLPEFNKRFMGISDNQLASFKDLALFFLIAFQEGARKENAECDISIDDIMEWYSEDPEKIAELLRLYTKSGGDEKKEKAQP
jgi:hypothetical protein